MRIRTLACLSLVAGACAVAATGFPRRIGLTASQADVSLPGDLILPGANVVVDRDRRPRVRRVGCPRPRVRAGGRVHDHRHCGRGSHPHARRAAGCPRRSRGLGHVRHCSAAALALAHASAYPRTSRGSGTRPRACVGGRRRRVAVVAVNAARSARCVRRRACRCLISLVPAVSVGHYSPLVL